MDTKKFKETLGTIKKEAQTAKKTGKPLLSSSFSRWLHRRWLVKSNREWVPFSFENHEYQRQWVERFEIDRHTIWEKAAQRGISEIHLAGAFFLADLRSASTIYFYPTDELAETFSQSRAKDSTLEIPYIRDNLKNVDNTGLKKFKKGFIHFRGAWDERKMTTIQADQVYLDEYDRLPEGMDTMAKDRLGHSDLKIYRAASTPTLPDFGIDFTFKRSSMNYFLARCRGCLSDIHIEESFPACMIDRGNTWYLACPRCFTPIDLSTCRWASQRPDEKDIIGYHITQLHAPNTPLNTFMKDYFTALEKGGTDLRRWWNGCMGMPHGAGAESLTDELLREISEDYGLQPYYQGRPTFMGIDQGDWLHILIFEGLEDGRFRLIWAEKTRDKTRPYSLMHQFQISKVVIDDKPNRDTAKDFVMAFKDKAAWCQFLKVQEPTEGEKDGVPRIAANRDLALETYVTLFYKKKILFPRKSEPEMDLVFSHHKKLITEDREDPNTGKVYKSYIKKVENHYALAGCYALLAARFAPVESGPVVVQTRIMPPPNHRSESSLKPKARNLDWREFKKRFGGRNR